VSATRVVVVGAGAFGGWSALQLLRGGAEVVLLDAWGPGNARASSGGETRAIRAIYGHDDLYSRWSARAFALWEESDRRWGTQLYRPTGALWLCGTDDRYVSASLPTLAEYELAVEALPVSDAKLRFSQIDFADVEHVYLEKTAGILFARRACRAVVDAFVEEGGRYRQVGAVPGPLVGGRVGSVELSDASQIEGDAFIFACGPWLAELFPALLEPVFSVSRQEVYYFGTPPGSEFAASALPIWVDLISDFYGIPASAGRGFKVADNRRGADFDPTAGDRSPTRDAIEHARAFLGMRFPKLAGAPLLEARVCQYTNTPDSNLVVDTHPEADNLWIVGGGSGHGFKLGPALGEHVARCVLSNTLPEAELRLSTRSRGRVARSIFDQEPGS
jgi:glycine/D-amino acid oxidase-like deaminating enzyme